MLFALKHNQNQENIKKILSFEKCLPKFLAKKFLERERQISGQTINKFVCTSQTNKCGFFYFIKSFWKLFKHLFLVTACDKEIEKPQNLKLSNKFLFFMYVSEIIFQIKSRDFL